MPVSMQTLTLKSQFNFCRNPLFLIGLALRIVLIVTILPSPVDQWYVPFLSNSIAPLTLDPWQSWLNQSGTTMAFPYGYAMWLFLLPFSLLCELFSLPLALGYGLSLVVADFGLLLILRKLLKTKDGFLLAIYWLSPISLIASYCLGYNDIIPVFLLMSAVYFMRDHRLFASGAFLIAAISAKLSMVLGLPFFLIHLFHNGNLRQIFRQFVIGSTLGFGVLFLPFLLSHAGINMVVSNPEIEKIYQLSINLVRNTAIYLVPLAYLLMLYAAWRIKRMNFELFNAILGIAFLLVVLLTPASPGWFIWILPLLISYQVSGDRTAIYITSIFSTLYALSAVLLVGTHLDETLQALGMQGSFINDQLINTRLFPLAHTALVATGIILAVRIWRETVSRNDFFRLSRKPFVMGVAGDSGAGKDTYVNAMIGLFGGHSVATISGDDYHLWDRHQPMWQVMTHINPAANDLESFAKNLILLTDSKSITACHYDHDTGKMSRPFTVKSNDIIIASGLHALYLPILRECYDLSVYLDINEELRKYFKIKRDVNQRGYSVQRVLDTLAKRLPDSEKFIRPQAEFADLIFRLSPINASAFQGTNTQNLPRLKLTFKSRHGFNELSLKRVLIGVCGLHVDMSNNSKTISEIEISVEGETSAEDIEMAARLICPKIFEFLDLRPHWQNGVLGLMQLITLSHINQALTRRFI